ncbi:hypothetical protein HDU87_001327 [Geranomyces variabilis]|uniref:Uncharacterized protein n=1 Tax=Geranomyces variabilis TaxID=109894 RepID=A0AAD5TPG0_9FUNG|nr:hypothetical protein HDU87_001327 [Geranomyces variabilis]
MLRRLPPTAGICRWHPHSSHRLPVPYRRCLSTPPYTASTRAAPSIPLPEIFTAHTSPAAHFAAYPWLLSTSPPRRPAAANSIWSRVRNSYLCAIGTARAQALFAPHGYAFPTQFRVDAGEQAHKLFLALSSPDPSPRETIMTAPLAARFAAADAALAQDGQRSVEFVLATNDAPFPPSIVRVTRLNFTYGPPDKGSSYVTHSVASGVTLLVPPEDAVFVSLAQQKEVMRRAMSAGVVVTVDARVACDVAAVVMHDGEIVATDARSHVDLRFQSPLVRPPQQDAKTLPDGWTWKVSDVDGLLESTEEARM